MARKSTPDKGRDNGPDKVSPRRMRGFEKADGLLANHIRKASEGRGFAVTRLLTHWAEVAGPELAAVTRPVKVGYGKGGLGATLTLLCAGAHGPLVQAQLPALRDRVNAVYGYAAISAIRLTQTAPTGFAEGQAEFAPAPKKKEPAPPAPDAVAAAEKAASGVQDEDLRAVLEQLGSRVMSRATN